MNWFAHLNPFHHLAGRIFIWFWLVLISAVFATLALSKALVEPTEIRRLPHSVITQIQQQIDTLNKDNTTEQLLSELEANEPERWIVVDSKTQLVLTPQLLPKDFDQHWITELSQLNKPRGFRHHNMFLAGPFIIERGDQSLALYQKRQRPVQPWWKLSEMPQNALIIFTLVISAIASFILAMSISRPLRELLQSNLQFADGQLDSRVKNLIKRGDELGKLGQSFNTMAERISALLTNQQRLLRDISHELRSPLARAQIALALSERQQSVEQLPRLKQELDRLDIMLDELLTFSKLDAGQYQLQKQEFDLPELVSDIINVNQVEADYKKQKLIQNSPSQLEVTADSRLLARAIENILRNAMKYSPDSSCITCRISSQDKWVNLTIEDEGPGIEPSKLDAIFEPFYRISDSRTSNTGGTGLGLAIVQQIIKQHGGKVVAHNREGHGLCITVQLPLN